MFFLDYELFSVRSANTRAVSEAEKYLGFCGNFFPGSEFYEYRYRQSGQLCSQFSPVLEFTISDCSVIVPPASTGQPLFHSFDFSDSD